VFLGGRLEPTQIAGMLLIGAGLVMLDGRLFPAMGRHQSDHRPNQPVLRTMLPYGMALICR
jgi:hypothetical protein